MSPKTTCHARDDGKKRRLAASDPDRTRHLRLSVDTTCTNSLQTNSLTGKYGNTSTPAAPDASNTGYDTPSAIDAGHCPDEGLFTTPATDAANNSTAIDADRHPDEGSFTAPNATSHAVTAIDAGYYPDQGLSHLISTDLCATPTQRASPSGYLPEAESPGATNNPAKPLVSLQPSPGRSKAHPDTVRPANKATGNTLEPCYKPSPPPDTQQRDTHPPHRDLIKIYDAVRASNAPNYVHSRIPLPHALNMSAWRAYLADYDDHQLCDFLEFGWPAGYTLTTPLQPALDNHPSARDYPTHIDQYIEAETRHGALLGPFSQSPFPSRYQVNPLMTRPKRDSNKRRIITDLSWPPAASVNDGIPRETYLGSPYKLRLPTVDDAVRLIQTHGQGCYLYGLDLARAYRQLRSDPLDWPLLGIKWNNDLYFDTAIPFGIRWGAMACSRTTQAVCYIHAQDNHSSLCYIDDFFGAAPPSKYIASKGFHRLRSLMEELGLKEATEKATPPTTQMTWIGVEFDTNKMVMRVPEFRIEETLTLVRSWACKAQATRHQLQQLLGKLFYISQCVRPARLFVSRMLDTLRTTPPQGHIRLDEEFQLDVLWFIRFLREYNGVHLIAPPISHEIAQVDSCLTGCGGIFRQEYYHTTFPESVLREFRPICHLEMLNILVAARAWAAQWEHKTVIIQCDNSTATNVLSSGRGRDPFLLRCAREIWYLSAKHNFTVVPTHVPGSQMQAADALSRAHLRPDFHRVVSEISNGKKIHIPEWYFDLWTTV